MLDFKAGIVQMFKEFIKTCQTKNCQEVATIKENEDQYFCAECALKRQKQNEHWRYKR